MRNYYEILGISYEASQSDIKKAYISLAKKYHPDTTIFDKTASEQIMKEITLAYGILSDPNKRAAYDRTIGIGQKSTGDNQDNVHSEHHNFVTLVNSINAICLETIQKIKNEASQANIITFDNILNVFQKKISINVKKALESPFMEDGILEGVGIVYYMLGAHYFSLRYFDKAKHINDCALLFLPKGEKIYNEALTARDSIDRAMKNTDSNNAKSVLKKIAIGFFILFALYSLTSNNTKNSYPSYQGNKNTQTSKNSPNTHGKSQTPINQPKPKNIELIPKKGVASGYVAGSPLLNNTGLCELTIDNTQNNAPVYVRLWNLDKSPKPVRAINIATNSSFTIKNINPGNYEIRYKYIYENANAETGSKSESFKLQQIQTYDGTQYSIVRLTLYKVVNGNTRTYQISGDNV